jgi:chromosome partitioning protein
METPRRTATFGGMEQRPNRALSAARKIAIVNHKGGVGKTCLSIHLAGAFAEMGYRALACDCDSQGDLSKVYLPKHSQSPHTIADIFSGTGILTKDLTQATQYQNLWVLPADFRLNAHDKTAEYHLDPAARLLADALTEVEHEFDMIVFDCPPRPHLTGFAALVAANEVIVPVVPSRFAIECMSSLHWELDAVRQRLNPNLRLRGYVLSLVKPRSTTHQTYRGLLAASLQAGSLLETMIPEMAALDTAINLGKPVTVHSPRSKSAAVIRAFAKELLADHTAANGQHATAA